ncbi:ice-binding family protein [Streptomyces sp. NBC_01142]|uniref:ice-binding family protein n=1 Tax=Streptomyces sp. NBC_01142 TaxID=2975865 RepID=UPI00225ABAC1|nr:ice-binding family protein [Streptomyces sp. NBC_01142]MCX4825639.1 ice-binding family protein [Streptomyces sp. NBC_01142]
MPVSPNQGSTGGGDAVTLTGSHFTGTTTVRYGSRQATSFTVVSDTTTDTITPSGHGPVPVSVTTPGGTGTVGTFYYLPPPSFRLDPPPAGPLGGGNTVTLTGVGLYTTSEVRFGTQAAVFTVDSDGQLTVVVPAVTSAGPVGVTVRARGGIASGVTYTYLDSPSITVVTLDSGPVDGNNLVVITGTAFSYTTGVTFDGTPAISYRIASDTEIDALLPVGELGPADVSVTTLGGTTTASDAYTYLGRFAVLGGQSVTNTGLSSITGDLGVCPGVSLTGFPPGQVDGSIHNSDADAVAAHADLITTYNNAVGQIPDASIAGDIGGLTLPPGVYNAASSIALSGTLTLDAQGDRNADWIFQVGSTLTTATASHVLLTNGATARNVIWLIGSSATLGTDTDFAGRILAQTSITVNAGVTVNGQVLAIDGSVTLDTNRITRPW